MRGIVGALTGCALLASGCTRARTELVVGLITNLSATDHIDQVTLTGAVDGRMPVDQKWTISGLPNMPAELPGSFGVYTSDGSQPSVTLTAVGWSNGQPVVTRKAIVTLVGEKTLFMRMGLVDKCEGATCGPDETCIEGACKPAYVDARTLPIYLKGMESGVVCPGGILYRNTSTKELVPIAGGGDCGADEQCVEGTCYKTSVPGVDLSGTFGPPLDMSVVSMPDLTTPPDLQPPPPDLWMPGLGCAAPQATTLAGNGSASYSDGTGGVSGSASFHDPTAITMGVAGTIYVADATNHRIRAVAADGTTTTLAGNGMATQTDGNGGAMGTASFINPRGIAFDGNHTLFVADGDQIRQVDALNGNTSLFAGSTSGYTEGVGAAAQFNAPDGIMWEPSCGCLYVADAGNHLVRVIAPAGGATTSLVAGVAHTAGYVDGAGGISGVAQFSTPSSVTANTTTIWVADLNNHRIRTITLGATPTVATLSGNGTPGYMEGAATIAQFNFPSAVVLGAGGIIYVADSGNDRIRAVASDGSTSLIAGNGTSTFSDGVAASASFYDPAGLAFDGGLFVADQLNQRIRRVVCP
jgi:hypothetical protein